MLGLSGQDHIALRAPQTAFCADFCAQSPAGRTAVCGQPMEASGGSQEYVVVGIISKLLTDLVARNDQVHTLAHHVQSPPIPPNPQSCERLRLAWPAPDPPRRALAAEARSRSLPAHPRAHPLRPRLPRLQLPLVPTQVTPFHSSRPPAITVKSYLEDRILKYAGCSEETFILALIYMDQVVQFNPDFVISSLNVHRLLITAIMLASKFFDDVYYNNSYYARVGGISNQEVNSLEMEMLRMISFSLFVQPEQYERYRGSLYSHLQSQPQAGLGAGAAADAASGGLVSAAAAANAAVVAAQQQQQQQSGAPVDVSAAGASKGAGAHGCGHGGGGAAALFNPAAYSHPAVYGNAGQAGFAAAAAVAAAAAGGGGGGVGIPIGASSSPHHTPPAQPQQPHMPGLVSPSVAIPGHGCHARDDPMID